VENVIDARLQVFQPPGEFRVDGRDEVQGDGEEEQRCQAKQYFRDSIDSLEHGQDYKAKKEKQKDKKIKQKDGLSKVLTVLLVFDFCFVMRRGLRHQ
jgi:hypothetical protein